MARNPARTVYIGNLDEKVSERVLYEILIQVGRVVDLYIPRDKETSRHKGYAFAEYESEEIAEYAVRLFSGLVRLHNKTLKFAISGQDKPSQNTTTLIAPRTISPPLPKPNHMHTRGMNVARESAHSMGNNYRSSGNEHCVSSLYPPVSSSRLASQNNHNSDSYEYSRRMFGVMLNNARDRGGPRPIA